MSRARRLEQLAKLAAEQEKQAAKALASAASRLEEANARLKTLYRFRSEYLQPSELALSAIQLHQLHAFLRGLSSAIAEQEAALQKLRQEYAALQLAWQRAYCRHRGIDKVQADLFRQEQAALERRLQGELEDRAVAKRRIRRMKDIGRR